MHLDVFPDIVPAIERTIAHGTHMLSHIPVETLVPDAVLPVGKRLRTLAALEPLHLSMRGRVAFLSRQLGRRGSRRQGAKEHGKMRVCTGMRRHRGEAWLALVDGAGSKRRGAFARWQSDGMYVWWQKVKVKGKSQ